jgi:type VI secretion system protein ImpL
MRANGPRFVQGVTIADLNGFDAGVQAMNRLGDPQASPLAKVLRTVYEQTAWDDPGQARVDTVKLKRGMLGWFREVVLRQAPSVARQLADAAGPLPLGGIRRWPGRSGANSPASRAWSASRKRMPR